MSLRSRGQEAAINFTVSDEFLAAFGLAGNLTGAFAKVRDFTVTPRIEQNETGYLGEDSDDLDQQVNGFDFAFTCDELDAQAVDFLSLIVFKEQGKLPPPVITTTVSYLYRDPFILPRTEIYIACILKVSERSIPDRKEYINTGFEGKAKYRQVQIG